MLRANRDRPLSRPPATTVRDVRNGERLSEYRVNSIARICWIYRAKDALIRRAQVRVLPGPWGRGWQFEPETPLPVSRRLVGRVSLDRVETRISDQSFDQRQGSTGPRPVRVDIRGDAPRVVGRPDERGRAA